MAEDKKNKKENKIKKFFSGLAEKLDKKLEEKAKKSSSGCCGPQAKGESSCCS